MDLTMMTDLFEAITIFCFGLSWPLSIHKSVVSKTSKGKSLMFEVFVLSGYAVGIVRKFIQVFAMGSSGFIFYLSFLFYVLNFIMISVDIMLYFRNNRLDRERDIGKTEEI